MADRLTHYIIFHKKLYPENTPDFPCFRYLAANENIPKEIDNLKIKHPISAEYGFPGYNPIYQQLNFCDQSVYLNIPAPSTEFIGICQYDMPINKDKFQLVLNNLVGNTVVGFFMFKMSNIFDILTMDSWQTVLNGYNQRNNTNHKMNDFRDTPFFLMSSFVMPTWFFVKIQNELRASLPVIFKILRYDLRHITGTLERTTALLIACAIKEQKINMKISDALGHSESQRIFDSFRHS